MAFAVPTRSVYVGNIPYSSTEESLREAFAEYEPVSIKMIEGKGVAFIEVPARRAYAMVRDTDGSKLEGRMLSVSVATPRANEYTTPQDQPQNRDERPPYREGGYPRRDNDRPRNDEGGYQQRGGENRGYPRRNDDRPPYNGPRPGGYPRRDGDRPPYSQDRPSGQDQNRGGSRPPYNGPRNNDSRGGYVPRDGSRPPYNGPRNDDSRGGYNRQGPPRDDRDRPNDRPYQRPDNRQGGDRPWTPRGNNGGYQRPYNREDSRPPRADEPNSGQPEGRPNDAPPKRRFEAKKPKQFRGKPSGPSPKPRNFGAKKDIGKRRAPKSES